MQQIVPHDVMMVEQPGISLFSQLSARSLSGSTGCGAIPATMRGYVVGMLKGNHE